MCIPSAVWTVHAQGRYEIQKGHQIMNRDLGISASDHCRQDVENGKKATSSKCLIRATNGTVQIVPFYWPRLSMRPHLLMHMRMPIAVWTAHAQCQYSVQ